MKEVSQRGAVAVELALLLPVLLLLLLGIMEFGRAYNAQVTLTNAAREGARVMAITNVQSDATVAARKAMPTLSTTDANPGFAFKFTDKAGTTYSGCAAKRQVAFTVSYDLDSLTGLAGPFSMIGKGAMQCGG